MKIKHGRFKDFTDAFAGHVSVTLKGKFTSRTTAKGTWVVTKAHQHKCDQTTHWTAAWNNGG